MAATDRETEQQARELVVQYVGFWARVGATLIDTVIMILITIPPIYLIYGSDYFYHSSTQLAGPADFIISYVLPAVLVILFWRYRSATPGKMFIHARIVNAKTLQPPSTGQLIGRYFAYYVSIIPLMLGFIWVAFDPRKQGFHDKLAGTLVIRDFD